MRYFVAICAALLPLAPVASAQTLYECVIDGRAHLLSGEGGAPPEGCTVADSPPSAESALSERLDAQEREIERLSRQLRALSRRSLQTDLPRPERRAVPMPDRPLTDTDHRRRELGQDIERKLEDLRR